MGIVYKKGSAANTNFITIYVNGIQASYSSTNGYINPITTTGMLVFANSPGNVAYGPSMQVSDYRIYSRDLSAYEVNSIYNGF